MCARYLRLAWASASLMIGELSKQIQKDIDQMRVTYRYPALVTSAKLRSETVKGRRIVPMLDYDEIPEYSTNDISVAAMVPMAVEDNAITFRFHDGRFYRSTELEVFDERSSGLEQAVGEAIGDHLIQERAYRPMIAPYVIGLGDTAGAIWSLWKKARQTPGSHVDPSYIREATWEAFKPFDADKMNDDLLGKWRDVASGYVKSLLMIDGKLWVPTKEPMMRSELVHSRAVANRYTFDDASCYLSAYGRPSGLPVPYGSNEVSANALHLLHPYWNPRCRYLSLPQATDIASDKTGWLGDVLLPEAFTVEHDALQLDRAARQATCFIGHLIEESVPTPSRQTLSLQKALRRVTKVPTDERDFEVIAEALAEFTDHISPDNREFSLDADYYIKEYGIREAAMDALDRWNDRTVDIRLGHGIGTP